MKHCTASTPLKTQPVISECQMLNSVGSAKIYPCFCNEALITAALSS